MAAGGAAAVGATASPSGATTPVGPPALLPCWDLIVANVFLHHFDAARLELLLTAIGARAPRFFACEPRRSWLPLIGSHLIGALGVNAVTRDDAVSSVQAGFRQREISALWPGRGRWQLDEWSAGLFSHCFRAIQVASPSQPARRASPVPVLRRLGGSDGPMASTRLVPARHAEAKQ